jgi:hypothetical protein
MSRFAEEFDLYIPPFFLAKPAPAYLLDSKALVFLLILFVDHSRQTKNPRIRQNRMREIKSTVVSG